jgi:AcrR family transcriptional regulator
MARMEGRRAPREDRRSQRTRRMLGEALVALMLDKRYDTITVQEIIDQANVGRSTFYAHFLDKEDLLQHQVAQVVLTLSHQMRHTADGNSVVPSLELFRHLRDRQDLIRSLVRGRAMDTVLKTMHAHLNSHIETSLARRLPSDTSPNLPLPLVAHYAAGVLLSLFDWWLERDMRETPEEVDAYFVQLVGPSIRVATGIEI